MIQYIRYFLRVVLALVIVGGVFVVSNRTYKRELAHTLQNFYYSTQTEKVHKNVRTLMQNKDYKKLLSLLKDQIDRTISFDEVLAYGQHYQCQPIIDAYHASKIIIEKVKLKSLHNRDIFGAVLFVEQQLQEQVTKDKLYFPKAETALAFDIEYDIETNARFIHLEGIRGAKLGKGHYKIVSRSILYDTVNPEIVARAIQDNTQRREIALTKLLMGKKGIVEAIAVTSPKTGKKRRHAIFTKLYSPGCLHSVLIDPSFKFTVKEKMEMALNILEGISSLHDEKIAHRDLGARNYLVNIEVDPHGPRKVLAVVSDLGRAISIKHAAFTKPQGNQAYLAPEAFFRSKMGRKDYMPADIYAAGCVLYQLYYETISPWQAYARTIIIPTKATHQTLVNTIFSNCQKRFDELKDLRSANTLSPQEEFELLILKMCSPDPKNRGTAHELRDEMKRICGKDH